MTKLKRSIESVDEEVEFLEGKHEELKTRIAGLEKEKNDIVAEFNREILVWQAQAAYIAKQIELFERHDEVSRKVYDMPSKKAEPPPKAAPPKIQPKPQPTRVQPTRPAPSRPPVHREPPPEEDIEPEEQPEPVERNTSPPKPPPVTEDEDSRRRALASRMERVLNKKKEG